MNFEISNIDNSYIYLSIYLKNGMSTVSLNLYKEEMDFFIELRKNIHNKNYSNYKEQNVLGYMLENLTISFNLHNGTSIFNIEDKDFIKIMCDHIINMAKDINF
jgi:hypothetical protein